MKKVLLSVFLSATLLTFNVNAQDANAKAHWSAAIKGGLDYFRVDPDAGSYKSQTSWTVPGLTLEYTINPLVGLGGELQYLAYNRNNSVDHSNGTFDVTLFGAVNLSNLLIPKRTSNWSLYGKLGAGAAFYHYNVYTNDGYSEKKDGSGVSPVVVPGLLLEYSLGKSWALNGELQYRIYTKNDLGGETFGRAGDNNDAIAATIGLRYKFGAKSKSHVRNMSMDEFYPQPVPTVIEKSNPYDDTDIKKRLDALEKDNGSNKSRLDKLENDLKDLQNKPAGSSISASFDNIEFDFGSNKLTAESKATLDQVAKILNSYPAEKININGYTDNIGSNAVNKKLSQARAAAVKEYLISKGVKNISAVEGYGEDKPIASNSTAEGRQKNRRVEFEIIK